MPHFHLFQFKKTYLVVWIANVLHIFFEAGIGSNYTKLLTCITIPLMPVKRPKSVYKISEEIKPSHAARLSLWYPSPPVPSKHQKLNVHPTLNTTKKCPYLELFWPALSHIQKEYEEIRNISPYSVRMRENADQNNFEYEQFSRSGMYIRRLYDVLYILWISLRFNLGVIFTEIFFEKLK